MYNKIIKGLKKDGRIVDGKLPEMTPEQQKETTEKVAKEIDRILVENNCEIMPVTEIFGSQLRSYIKIIIKPVLKSK